MTWRTDFENMPKGTCTEHISSLKGKKRVMRVWTYPKVILAVRSPMGQETVVVSRWYVSEDKRDKARWEMISEKDQIVAWQYFPEFPNE